MNEERSRIRTAGWKDWGPYVSDRQWETVREFDPFYDYFSAGNYIVSFHTMLLLTVWKNIVAGLKVKTTKN